MPAGAFNDLLVFFFVGFMLDACADVGLSEVGDSCDDGFRDAARVF